MVVIWPFTALIRLIWFLWLALVSALPLASPTTTFMPQPQYDHSHKEHTRDTAPHATDTHTRGATRVNFGVSTEIAAPVTGLEEITLRGRSSSSLGRGHLGSRAV